MHALNGFDKRRNPIPERVEGDVYEPRLPAYSKDAPSVQSGQNSMMASYQVAAIKLKVHEDYKPNMALMNHWEKILLKGLPLKHSKQK